MNNTTLYKKISPAPVDLFFGIDLSTFCKNPTGHPGYNPCYNPLSYNLFNFIPFKGGSRV